MILEKSAPWSVALVGLYIPVLNHIAVPRVRLGGGRVGWNTVPFASPPFVVFHPLCGART